MKKPLWITFTGLDERTDLKQCKILSDQYPIEWGVLVGGRLGKSRYPTDKVLAEILRSPLQLAMHMCGPAAKWMNDGMPILETPPEGVSTVAMTYLNRVNRIQVNRARGQYDLKSIWKGASHLRSDQKILVQHRGETLPFSRPDDRIHYLHDESGGKGIATKEWAHPSYRTNFVGYAGGLNPDNVAVEVARMPANNFWIDMETGLRTDDWLDLDKCRAVCEAVYG